MVRTPTALLSPADRARRRALRRMQTIATAALVALAIVFALAFALQEQYPWVAYVRAAAEGGMVGALADWFAVTALFRRPLGLPIPHTAIIPTRKDEIGRALGEFVETNFLSAEVVRTRLGEASLAPRLGAWLAEEPHAERVVSEASVLAAATLRALDDEEVGEVIESLAREHLIVPEWAPPLGERLAQIVAAGAHHGAVDLAADTLATWLRRHPDAFAGLVSGRLPSWAPRIAQRLVDEAVYREATQFVSAVRADPAHPARRALDDYLARLAEQLQHDPRTIGLLEDAKLNIFDSPRVRDLASRAWDAARRGLLASLEDPASELRARARTILVEVGGRLGTDAGLQRRVDAWIVDAAVVLVERYRHDIASIITDTIERWDPAETTEKIELMVGRDLQYIRLNGTIVGSLAGLAIFTVAQLVLR
jgi:uncharacterized membrane-anchored protein YjiN (DUF445 family)